MHDNWKIASFGLLLLACVAWWYFTPDQAPSEQWTPAKIAPEVVAVPKESITPPKVQVYAQIAKKKLKLPEQIQADPDKHVIESTRVEADEHPNTVTSIIDEKTGDVQTLVRREPLPWLAANKINEIRFDYGIKNALAAVGRVSFHEDLFQVKAVHAGLNATLDTDGAVFVGGGIGYRW